MLVDQYFGGDAINKDGDMISVLIIANSTLKANQIYRSFLKENDLKRSGNVCPFVGAYSMIKEQFTEEMKNELESNRIVMF